MKTVAGITLLSALALAPMAQAAGSMEDVNRIVTAASDHGVSHFNELETEDGRMTEVEGWLDDEWHVEVAIDGSGDIGREERQKRIDGAWGMTTDQVRQYAEAAFGEGLTRIEEISVDTSGQVEVEGYGKRSNGEEGEALSVHFRLGDTTPSDVRRD
ncbi:hypothetical protein [Halovibrio salipaludis]|nr:hypothetical protein [Halovibrio salipaludis]